ncbi:transmembrane protein 150C isoform X1 [Girardinichthys multiradiatus]|uniref:transmembrane protein 150C isoform X1 n=1 Tax=Girardinichthys multiradiatus TaxID=208333 RepID=UPI001FAD4F7C|nr:transmembrane protein 150C isoform X1 [Girardinichthys multiradiatus]
MVAKSPVVTLGELQNLSAQVELSGKITNGKRFGHSYARGFFCYLAKVTKRSSNKCRQQTARWCFTEYHNVIIEHTLLQMNFQIMLKSPTGVAFLVLLALFCFSGFVMGILRYIQLKNRLDKPWLNIVSVASFSIACFGMTIVGNFQLFELGLIHDVGTLMTFGLGTLYCWMQSYITLRVNLKNEGRAVAISRFLLSAAITLCIILKQALVVIPHMHSVRCQWALVMFFLIFMGTFAIEFRHCRFDVVCRDAVEHQSWPEASGQRQELQESHTVLYLNTLSSDLHRTS